MRIAGVTFGGFEQPDSGRGKPLGDTGTTDYGLGSFKISETTAPDSLPVREHEIPNPDSGCVTAPHEL